MCISERLKLLLDTKGISIKEFSELTGLSYRSAMNYLNEGRDPSVEALIKIHQAMQISITWLLTGNGSMFNTNTKKNAISFSEQEEKLIANYRLMPNNLKEAFDISFNEISKKS